MMPVRRRPVIRIIGVREDARVFDLVRGFLAALDAETSDFLSDSSSVLLEDAIFEWAPQLDAEQLRRADAAVVIASSDVALSPYALAEIAYALGERRPAARDMAFR